MIKEKIVWTPEMLFAGKNSKYFWKKVDKAKTKKDLLELIRLVIYNISDLEERLVELKKFRGKKRKY
jgi:hypothetical protein